MSINTREVITIDPPWYMTRECTNVSLSGLIYTVSVGLVVVAVRTTAR